MGDMKNVAIVCASGDGGRVLGARPSEIDACQYHGLNYMAVARSRANPVTIGLMVTANAGLWVS
jgi:hypothetical protein